MDRWCESIIRLMNSLSKQGIHKYGNANYEPRIKFFELHLPCKVNINEFEPLLMRLSVFHYTVRLCSPARWLKNVTRPCHDEFYDVWFTWNLIVVRWASSMIHIDGLLVSGCFEKKKRKIDESNRDWGKGTNVGVSSRPWTLRFRVVPLEIHASPVAATAVRWRTLAKLFRNMYKVIVNTRHARYTWSHYTPENDTEHVAPIRSFSYSVPFVWNGGENGAAAISRETFTSARTRAVRVAVVSRI